LERTTLMTQRDPLPPAQLRALFAGLLLAMFLAALDSTIVATALPTIVDELGGLERLSWVVTAYLLAQTVAIPLYGKLGDLYGRKVVLQAAIVIFLVGSALCGLSTGMFGLIAFRVIQGLGGGGLIVTSQAAIGDVLSPRDRGRYQGIMGAAFGVASVAGPLLGGFFTSNLSWRWIFYINLPLGIVALVMVGATLPRITQRVRHTIDYAGAALLAAALSATVLLTDLGGLVYPWMSAPTITLMIVAAIAIVGFIVVERRATEPILPLRLFRDRTFLLASLISISTGFALFGSVTYLPVFLQVVKGSSPTASGLEMLPIMAGTLVASIVSGQLISRTGRYKIFPVAGTATAAIGLILLSQITLNTSLQTLVVKMLTLGIGLGLVTQVLVVAAQNAARFEDLGVTTSGVTLFRLIGGSVGTAMLGTLFASQLPDALPPGGVNAHTLATLPPDVAEGIRAAIAAAMGSIFKVAALVAAAGLVFSLLIPERPLRETVAAASSSIGHESGEAFAMPSSDDSSSELLRGLSILANRDVQRAYVEGIVTRAGLTLGPAAAWLLLRMEEQPDAAVRQLAKQERIPEDRVEVALAELKACGYFDETRGNTGRDVTDTGRAAQHRLSVARRERLEQLHNEWPAWQRERLATTLQRLARDLVPPRAA
jgi:EmrB/QacA subfamily drug resistance transporter